MEHFDVVVVGAGISGIGAGYFLQRECPNATFAIIEGREALGGTWDLFRYPGVRSDSDMHTLGYSFKPWTADKSIADGPSILSYLNETVDQFGLRDKIRFNTLVTSASWSTDDAKWTLTASNAKTGEQLTYSCNFLYMCSGYYSYKSGYTPEFPGIESFTGIVVHPQKWPESLDYAYGITRWKNTTMQQFVYKRTRTKPQQVKDALLKGVRDALGEDYDVETHFTPSYNPWDQRLCLVPNGDLFTSIKEGSSSVVTDHIERIDATGIQLVSGARIDCDVIVTATGLNLVTLGEMSFSVDGEAIDFSRTWSYKGCAYSGVPNLASSFGYINASWTLRADLTCEYVCRLINHMRKTRTSICTPTLRESDANMPERPWIDNFSAGYMERVMHQFPRQGDKEPWINPQNYKRDKKMFRESPIDDGVMIFSAARERV
jgi:cation diffusion facilitator CzcD-associated flavoprotein CzcO